MSTVEFILPGTVKPEEPWAKAQLGELSEQLAVEHCGPANGALFKTFFHDPAGGLILPFDGAPEIADIERPAQDRLVDQAQFCQGEG